MKITEQQRKYLDAVDGKGHQHAVHVIGVMERALAAQSKLLVAYRIGTNKAPSESAFKALKDAREIGLQV